MSHGRSMCMPKRKAKILIVDDAQINRIILCELLRDQYQILEAEDGKKALEIMKEDKMIDLVLLDIVMPNMDGYQVLEKMKEQRYLENIFLLLLFLQKEIRLLWKRLMNLERLIISEDLLKVILLTEELKTL